MVASENPKTKISAKSRTMTKSIVKKAVILLGILGFIRIISFVFPVSGLYVRAFYTANRNELSYIVEHFDDINTNSPQSLWIDLNELMALENRDAFFAIMKVHLLGNVCQISHYAHSGQGDNMNEVIFDFATIFGDRLIYTENEPHNYKDELENGRVISSCTYEKIADNWYLERAR